MERKVFMVFLICCYGPSRQSGEFDAKTINERDFVFYYEHTEAGQEEWLEHQEISASKKALKRKQREKRKERRKIMAEELD